jgi:small-conductance mechanosensitive channel
VVVAAPPSSTRLCGLGLLCRCRRSCGGYREWLVLAAVIIVVIVIAIIIIIIVVAIIAILSLAVGAGVAGLPAAGGHDG